MAESHPQAKLAEIFTTREKRLLNTKGFFPKQRPSFQVPLKQSSAATFTQSIFTAEPFDDEQPVVWENQLRGRRARLSSHRAAWQQHQEKVWQQFFDSEKAAARRRRAKPEAPPSADGTADDLGYADFFLSFFLFSSFFFDADP